MSFECSNRAPMMKRTSVRIARNEGHTNAAMSRRELRSLWLSAQFLGCAVLLAACGGGGGAGDSVAGGTDPEGVSPAPAPVPSPSPAPAPAPASVGSASLSWAAPQTNADGSALVDLAGYRIYYGTAQGTYGASVTISDPSVTTYTVSNLKAATYYFVLKAFDKSDVESAASPEVSKTIK